MGVSELKGSTTAQLITMKTRMEANFRAQEAAVEKLRMESTHAKEQKADQQVKVGKQEMDFDMAVTTLANFKIPKHTLESMPVESNYPIYEKIGDGDEVTMNQEAYDKFQADLQKWNDEEAEIKAAQEQQKVLEAAVDKAREELGISKDALNDLIKKAGEVEAEFLKNEEIKDHSIQDLQEIDKKIAESQEKVTIDGSNNSRGMVDQTLNDMVAAGIITKEQLAALRKDPEAMKKFAAKYVEFDNTNNNRSLKDGMDMQYTKGKITKGEFTASQLSQMLSDTTTDSATYSYGKFADNVSNVLASDKPTEPKPPKADVTTPGSADPDDEAPATDPNAHYKKGNVTLARGIPYNTYGDDPAKWGFYQDETGNYSIRDMVQASVNIASGKDPGQVRNLSDDELNEAMRKAEETVHPGYSKLLDKAENYDIDIDKIVKPGMTGEEAYKAVKAEVKKAEALNKEAEKLNKAEKKYAAEIQQYGIDVTKYNTADELKAAIKAAKKAPATTTPSIDAETQRRIDQQQKLDALNASANGASYVVQPEPEMPKSFKLDHASQMLLTQRGGTSTVEIEQDGQKYTVTREISDSGNKYTIDGQEFVLKDNKLVKKS